MNLLTALTALVFAMSGEVKYPAICKDTYLSDVQVKNVAKTERALSRKPGCMKIGEEIISEGDRTGETFSIFTCCTSL